MADENETATHQPDREETREKTWKKIIQPTEKKGGYTGTDFSDDIAPEGRPGVVRPEPTEEPPHADE